MILKHSRRSASICYNLLNCVKCRNLDSDALIQLPGHPPVTAERFPLPSGKAYYKGKGLLGRRGDRLVGRAAEYDELVRVASAMLDGTGESTALSVSGIGGIGYFEHEHPRELHSLTTLQENRVTSNVCPSISGQV